MGEGERSSRSNNLLIGRICDLVQTGVRGTSESVTSNGEDSYYGAEDVVGDQPYHQPKPPNNPK